MFVYRPEVEIFIRQLSLSDAVNMAVFDVAGRELKKSNNILISSIHHTLFPWQPKFCKMHWHPNEHGQTAGWSARSIDVIMFPMI